MSTPAGGHDAGQNKVQADAAEPINPDIRPPQKGRKRPRAAPAGRRAETLRANAEGVASIDPLVADQALTASERQSDRSGRPHHEVQQTPEGALAEAQALKVIESRHDALQAVPAGALGSVAAHDAATRDVEAMSSLVDPTVQSRAAAMLGDTADRHPSYRAALREVSPQYADLAQQAFAADQQQSAAKEERKAFEFADRRDDAADSIATRYANMARAGLSVKDLQGPALERLAIKDSRDLLLLDGQPPHPRADEAKARVAESLTSEAYRTTFTRETAEWTSPDAGRQPGFAASTTIIKSQDPVDLAHQTEPATAVPTDQKQSPKTPIAPDRMVAETNSMRSEGDTTDPRRVMAPLEDRFNVTRIGLVEREYRFRDQAGKVAFTDKLLSISTDSESPAALKAMVDRAAERGWVTVHLTGSPEFVRQGWIAAHAQGLKAVGHTPTTGDRQAALKEQTRLQVGPAAPAPQRQDEAIARAPSAPAHVEPVSGGRRVAGLSGQRQLAVAIEKALVDGNVSPEIRGQVRAMMTAEGARRVAAGEQFKVPVYDTRAPRARAKTVQTGPQRLGDRERSR